MVGEGSRCGAFIGEEGLEFLENVGGGKSGWDISPRVEYGRLWLPWQQVLKTFSLKKALFNQTSKQNARRRPSKAFGGQPLSVYFQELKKSCLLV